MAIIVSSYQGIDSLRFGISQPQDAIDSYGLPKFDRKNRLGAAELEYDLVILRFDDPGNTLQEFTLLPRSPARIGEIEITWDQEFLRAACQADGDPQEASGLIVLANLGIAITGIHDQDDSQLAVTAFCEKLRKVFLNGGKPFRTF